MKRTVIASIALAGGLVIAAPLLASAQTPSPPPVATAPAPAADQAPPSRPLPWREHGMRDHGIMGRGMGDHGMMDHDMRGPGMRGWGMRGWHHHGGWQGRHGWMHHEGRWARSPAERCSERLARRAGMVAYTMTRLDLSATQRPIWDKLNAVLEAGTAKEQQLCSALAAASQKGGETILDRIGHREKFLTARLDTLQHAQPILERLYKTLSPGQKAIINHPFRHG